MTTTTIYRNVKITIETTIESYAGYNLDETAYLEWLDGAEDTEDQMLEFLEAGNEPLMLQDDIYDAARLSGHHGATDGHILRVERWAVIA